MLRRLRFPACLRPVCGAVAFLGAALMVAAEVQASPDVEGAPEAPAPAAALSPPGPDELVLALDIPQGSSFGPLVSAWGVPEATVRAAAAELHDLANIRPDRELAVVLRDGEEAAVGVRYAVDADQTVVVSRGADGAWTAALDAVVYTPSETTMVLTIASSLWQAALDAGLRPGDLFRLAAVFEYEVDFNTEVHAGDQLAFVAEVLSAEGRPDKLGTLHAVRFDNAGKRREVVRFEHADGEVGYYHPDGTASRRAFLRSPLEFSRVTSGFNPRRYHPILKTRRPHNGTDFGAPTGTPVRVVADGKVVEARVAGGHGNFVKVVHDNGFATSYSHLSRILVKTGQRVRQGDHIGRVGSTGLATGPHLHYQMWKNGQYVDPMRVQIPVTRQLAGAELDAFKSLAAQWMPRVPSLGDAATTR
jgi:murein DD-endopeptidase MepM/ murein hydrolase activator NlpD